MDLTKNKLAKQTKPDYWGVTSWLGTRLKLGRYK